MRRSKTTERASHQSAEAGEALVLRYLKHHKEETRSEIVDHYEVLVQRIARKYKGFDSLDDLVQVGTIGLLNALKKFDPTAGVRFTTYATYLISGEIKHYLRDRTQMIRHPAWLQELRHRVNRASNVLQQELGRPADEHELAGHLDVSVASIREVLSTQDMLKVASLDAAIHGDDDSETEIERLDAADFCVDQLTMEDRLVLEQAMSQLRDLEREVLILFHFHSMNQTEIAGKLAISGNYVSHILRQSLAKLRKILVAENERDRVLRRQASAVNYEVLDPLTGAYTEVFFRMRLEEEVHRATCEGTAVGVVTVNFSGLEALRNFYGEASINAFLSDATTFVRDNVRRLDLVCRFGETGFGIILPATGKTAVVAKDRLVNRLGEWLATRFVTDGAVRAELGHGSYPEEAPTARALLALATTRPPVADAA